MDQVHHRSELLSVYYKVSLIPGPVSHPCNTHKRYSTQGQISYLLGLLQLLFHTVFIPILLAISIRLILVIEFNIDVDFGVI